LRELIIVFVKDTNSINSNNNERRNVPYGLFRHSGNSTSQEARSFIWIYADQYAYYRKSKGRASKIWVNGVSDTFSGFARRILSHELQYVIQNIEGFSRGARPDERGYRSKAGEVEATNEEIRSDLSKEERSKLYSVKTQEITRKFQFE